MFTLSRDTKRWFFDREGVQQQLSRKAIAALTRIGGFIRTTARRSMRRKTSGPPSKPGTPPFARVGTLRDQLFFAYDPSTMSVIVGPVGLGKAEVPALHEYGGSIAVEETLYSIRKAATARQAASFRRLVVEGKIKVKPKPKRIRRLAYPARPYMGPALEIAADRGVIADEFALLAK
jgi:hypothetical protein